MSNSLSQPLVILLNGSINAGKTTVAKAICHLLPRTAHIEVDALRDFVPWMALEESIPLNLQNAVAVGRNFLAYGLNIVVSYPLARTDYEFLAEQFQGFPVHCFTLSPPLDVALQNRGERELTAWERERIVYHYHTGISQPDFGVILDNAEQSPEETAEAIVCRLWA